MSVNLPTLKGAVSAKLQQYVAEQGGLVSELAAGVTAGFPVISFRGKVWRVKHRGEEKNVLRPDGDPAYSLELVVVKAAANISKIFYEKGFEEGSSAPPDCWSTTGITPDAGAAKKQSATCAGCPHNAWGSKVTPAGKKAKACTDSKRIAVAPLLDLDNSTYGAPMLLRVPAASLSDMATYGGNLAKAGYPDWAVGTKISFDQQEAYPKMVFNVIRALDDEELDKVIAMRDSPEIERILSEPIEEAHAEPVDSQAAEIAAALTAPPSAKVAAAKAAAEKPKTQPKPEPAKVALSEPPATPAVAEVPKKDLMADDPTIVLPSFIRNAGKPSEVLDVNPETGEIEEEVDPAIANLDAALDELLK
jgi:hypothetical protein